MIQLLWRGEYLIFVLLILALVLSLTIHELGHAMVAKWFGDDTAQRAGRITLNPIAHIDPIGLMMVIIVGFGFAKPVPTTPANFTSPQADLWVAAAGPAMNLLLAVGCWNLYLLAYHAGWTTPPVEIFFTLLAQINLLLMIFNLLHAIELISDKEMLKTFNCGVGFCLIINSKNLKKINKYFSKEYRPYIIGKISLGRNKVKLNGSIDWLR